MHQKGRIDCENQPHCRAGKPRIRRETAAAPNREREREREPKPRREVNPEVNPQVNPQVNREGPDAMPDHSADGPEILPEFECMYDYYSGNGLIATGLA